MKRKTITKAWVEMSDGRLIKVHFTEKDVSWAKKYDKRNKMVRTYIPCTLTF